MKNTIMVILDGWGIGQEDEVNPIYTAKTETIDYLMKNFPVGSLKASGLSVGLPWGEKGTSEVGHLTLGAGRVVDQHYKKINKSIENGKFFKNKALKKSFKHVKKNSSSLHLAGLLTKGSIHASIDHLKALLQMAKKENVSRVYLHLFLDEAPSSPEPIPKLIKEIRDETQKHKTGKIGSLSGKYYALDQNKNWEKTKKVYEAMTGQTKTKKVNEVFKNSKQKDLKENYIKPTTIHEGGAVKEGDALIFFNLRKDGINQLAQSFSNNNFQKFPIKDLKNLSITTMTNYGSEVSSHVAFERTKVENTLCEVLSKNQKMQIKITETEKEENITYFFNGVKNKTFENEYRILLPSDDLADKSENPRMKAREITDRAILSLEEGNFSFMLINYANVDIMAHTGEYQPTIDAVEFLDQQLSKLVKAALNKEANLLITSDHGNGERLFDPQTGKEETEHSTNPVPIHLVGKEFERRSSENRKIPKVGMLSDIAPTVLDLMNIKKPREMSGNSLVDIL
ncbi:MAG: 2,3-bisphosphoglycerate-independent phosphoglycerate mutase [Candidatus Magasanikbacteria bacterium]